MIFAIMNLKESMKHFFRADTSKKALASHFGTSVANLLERKNDYQTEDKKEALEIEIPEILLAFLSYLDRDESIYVNLMK